MPSTFTSMTVRSASGDISSSDPPAHMLAQCANPSSAPYRRVTSSSACATWSYEETSQVAPAHSSSLVVAATSSATLPSTNTRWSVVSLRATSNPRPLVPPATTNVLAPMHPPALVTVVPRPPDPVIGVPGRRHPIGYVARSGR